MNANPARQGGFATQRTVDNERAIAPCLWTEQLDVVHAGLLEGKPHELAAALDRGPGATVLPSRSISFILS
jgi:hypothetical protein